MKNLILQNPRHLIPTGVRLYSSCTSLSGHFVLLILCNEACGGNALIRHTVGVFLFFSFLFLSLRECNLGYKCYTIAFNGSALAVWHVLDRFIVSRVIISEELWRSDIKKRDKRGG